MAKWCRYCSGNYPKYYCDLINERVSWYEAENYCKNDAYKCPTYYKYGPYYIASFTCSLLNKGIKDKALYGIRVLRDNFMEVNNKYKSYLEDYDFIGPKIIENMNKDEEKEEVATKVYKILEGVSTFVSNGEIDKALKNYNKMVKALMNKYNLNEIYAKNKVKTLKRLD